MIRAKSSTSRSPSAVSIRCASAGVARESSATRSASLPVSIEPIRSSRLSARALPKRHSIKGLERRPRLAVELQHLVALGGRAQHRIARAPADVGRERDPYARPREPRLIEQAGAKEKIRRWAECGDGAAFRQLGDLAVLQMNAMAEDRSWPKKPGPRIDVDIASRLGKECRDARDLRLVLVGVGLDVELAGNSRASAPAASSCAWLDVTAKRGVIA